MKKFLIVLISGIIIMVGTQLMFASQSVDFELFHVFAIDGPLVFFARTLLGIIGTVMVVVATHTAVYQLTGVSLVKELYNYIFRVSDETEEVGDK